MKFTMKTPLLLLSSLISFSIQAANLNDVYQAALDSDPQLKAAQANYRASQETLPQSKSAMLPNISFSANTSYNKRDYQSLSESFNSNGYSAQLVQPLFRADIWYQYQGAKATVDQAEARFLQAQQDLVLRVATAYINILRAEDELYTSQTQEEALNRQLEQVQERFDVGLTAITDVHEAQAAYDLARVARISAEEARDNSRATLERLTGQSWDSIDILDKTMPVTQPGQTLQQWTELALANSLELQEAQSQIEANRENVKQQKSGHLPTLDFVASYNHSKSGGTSFLGSEIDSQVYSLEFNVPIYSGGGTGSRVRSASYQLEAAQENYQLLLRELKESIQTQLRTVSSDVLKVGAQKLALTSSESAFEATQGGYEVGTRNIVDLLQARTALYESQRDYANAIYDYLIDSLTLKRTSGTLSVEDLTALSPWLQQETE